MTDERPILLVDDSEQDQLLIRTALAKSGRGYNVESAVGVDDAIKRFLTPPPPALVFLDLQMPMKDGFELLRWLRARPEDWRRTPVVMLTTSHDYVEIRRAYDLGANSFLVKPTGFEELRDTLVEAASYWTGRNRAG